MRIAVFGVGHVGAVLCGCLGEMGHQVVAVDLNSGKIEDINRGSSPVAEPGLEPLISAAVKDGRLRATGDPAEAVAATELAFICVDTPGNPDGTLSLASLEQALGAIGDALRDVSHDYSVVVRSTVPPGTADDLCIPMLEARSGRRNGDRLTYLSNPEFFRQGSAVLDFLAPSVIYVGSATGKDIGSLREIYRGIHAPFHVGTFRSVESVKLLSNLFHGLKVAFANEAGAVLAACGVDAREALRLFCADNVLNISASYLRPGFAFGGPCLGKDLRSFLALARAAGLPTPLLGQVAPSNQQVIERTVTRILTGERRKVAMFGLTFKPGTAEIRESPYVTLALRLLKEGIALRIFDIALPECQPDGPQSLTVRQVSPDLAQILVRTPEEALDGCDLVVICHQGAVPMDRLLGLLTDQEVIDFEGIAASGALPYRPFGVSHKIIQG